MRILEKRSFHIARFIFTLGLLLFAPNVVARQVHERAPVATTPHFALYSDFATNLNDALIVAGTARKFDRPELFHSGEEAICLGEMPPSARSGWSLAVDFFEEFIAPVEFNQYPKYFLRMHLAGYGEEVNDAPSNQFIEIAKGFQSAATPTYRACRWISQDKENRHWIKEITALLAIHEQQIARRLEQLYQKPWDGLPIRTDVVDTVSWSGADSIIREPAGGTC